MKTVIVLLFVCAACSGSARVPGALLERQQREIRRAEAAGAAGVPEAAFYLKAARADVREAERQFLQDQPERGHQFLGAAQADVQLALAIAQAEAPTPLKSTSYPARALFEPNSAVLSNTGAALLDQLAEQLVRDPAPRVTLRAYTDAAGSPALDRSLSGEQAARVKDYLLSKGVSDAHVQAQGLGTDPQARAAARRRLDVVVDP